MAITTKQELQHELDRRILGRTAIGSQCSCGLIHCGEGTAVRVVPSDHEDDWRKWHLWEVEIRESNRKPNAPQDYDWSCGLDEFIRVDDLDRLFSAENHS